MSIITAVETHDIRFPTSQELDRSDAMNPDPDYSAAYGAVQTAAVAALAGHILGCDVDELPSDMKSTFGHFGMAGNFLCVDREAGWACAVLSIIDFGPWATRVRPAVSSGILQCHNDSPHSPQARLQQLRPAPV